MRERCPGGSENSPDHYLYHYQQVLLKNFALKCIPGLALVGVLPLGQGGRPPDVRVGLEILQTAIYIISSKFC